MKLIRLLSGTCHFCFSINTNLLSNLPLYVNMNDSFIFSRILFMRVRMRPEYQKITT